MASVSYEYYCPDCRSENNLHEPHCDLAGTQRADIEKAYIDILSVMTGIPNHRPTKDSLIEMVHGEWGMTRERVLQSLIDRYYISIEDDSPPTEYRLRTREEYEDIVKVPDYEPLSVIYEYGSVPGCHDNAIFALTAWYEYVGFDWESTKDILLSWFEDTGTWERGGFSESSPNEVIQDKKHVHERGYGFKEKADAAHSVIQSRRRSF